MKSAVNILNEGFNNLYKKALNEDKSLREGTGSNFEFFTSDDYEGVGYPHSNKEQALNAASSYIDLFMEKFDPDDVVIYVDVGISDGRNGDPIHQWDKNDSTKSNKKLKEDNNNQSLYSMLVDLLDANKGDNDFYDKVYRYAKKKLSYPQVDGITDIYSRYRNDDNKYRESFKSKKR